MHPDSFDFSASVAAYDGNMKAAAHHHVARTHHAKAKGPWGRGIAAQCTK
jgi:hypothetical protein